MAFPIPLLLPVTIATLSLSRGIGFHEGRLRVNRLRWVTLEYRDQLERELKYALNSTLIRRSRQ